eukprot:6173867-Pleurochrysis_carterae.AAC.1
MVMRTAMQACCALGSGGRLDGRSFEVSSGRCSPSSTPRSAAEMRAVVARMICHLPVYGQGLVLASSTTSKFVSHLIRPRAPRCQNRQPSVCPQPAPRLRDVVIGILIDHALENLRGVANRLQRGTRGAAVKGSEQVAVGENCPSMEHGLADGCARAC